MASYAVMICADYLFETKKQLFPSLLIKKVLFLKVRRGQRVIDEKLA